MFYAMHYPCLFVLDYSNLRIEKLKSVVSEGINANLQCVIKNVIMNIIGFHCVDLKDVLQLKLRIHYLKITSYKALPKNIPGSFFVPACMFGKIHCHSPLDTPLFPETFLQGHI